MSMTGDYTPLQKYLRSLPVTDDEVTLTFERIEQILNEPLPPAAYQDGPWWRNQQKGTYVEVNAWMDAGWMVEIVDLNQKWVRFVRQ
ncbi:MAG: hypothetical protein M3R47_08720 [Chloroflexota bacterium]|nr:hypothetical protein [Chloroflexota bacterium]